MKTFSLSIGWMLANARVIGFNESENSLSGWRWWFIFQMVCRCWLSVGTFCNLTSSQLIIKSQKPHALLFTKGIAHVKPQRNISFKPNTTGYVKRTSSRWPAKLFRPSVVCWLAAFSSSNVRAIQYVLLVLLSSPSVSTDRQQQTLSRNLWKFGWLNPQSVSAYRI